MLVGGVNFACGANFSFYVFLAVFAVYSFITRGNEEVFVSHGGAEARRGVNFLRVFALRQKKYVPLCEILETGDIVQYSTNNSIAIPTGDN